MQSNTLPLFLCKQIFLLFFFFLKEIRNAEIAQRTKETAPSMQLDNIAPLEYFLHLVTDFEQRMQFYK